MLQGFRDLDTILRGDATRLEALRGEGGGPIGEIGLAGRRLVPVLLLLGLTSGLCIGSYAVFRTYLSPEETVVGVPGAWKQLAASMVKVPLLFVLTLLVTMPSLYVFNALCGSRLRLASMFKLLLAMLGVTLAVLAALGPIVAFFGITSTSYAFMKLLNVAVFATAGFIGLTFLLRTLHRLVSVQEAVAAPRTVEEFEQPTPRSADSGEDEEQTLEQQAAARAARLRGLGGDAALGRTDPRTDRRAQTVFNCWLILFGLVGRR